MTNKEFARKGHAVIRTSYICVCGSRIICRSIEKFGQNSHKCHYCFITFGSVRLWFCYSMLRRCNGIVREHFINFPTFCWNFGTLYRCHGWHRPKYETMWKTEQKFCCVVKSIVYRKQASKQVTTRIFYSMPCTRAPISDFIFYFYFFLEQHTIKDRWHRSVYIWFLFLARYLTATRMENCVKVSAIRKNKIN